MPKLKKFKKNKFNIKNILISFAIIMGIMMITIISKSYAIYKLQQDYDVIKNKIGSYSMGDVRVAVLVDGKEASEFPTYETNYKVESIDCTNGVTATFDVENWQLNIVDMSATSTKCTVSFNSKETNEITPVNMSKTELLALNEEYQNVAYENLKTQLLNDTYPVGSIYMSTEDDTVEKVQEKFGGTWVSYSEGRTLIGVGSNDTTTYTVNSTGGSEMHNHSGTSGETALTISQIPSHKHDNTAVSSNINGTFACQVPNNHGSYRTGSFSAVTISSSTPDKPAGSLTTGALFGYKLSATPTITVTNVNAGGNESHSHTISDDSNLQPYTVVYMYKRTA